MNLVKTICNKLGVEVGKEWKGSDGKIYIINDMGAVCEVNNPDLTWKGIQSNWMRIISGELVSSWEPKIGDYCYMPNIYKKCVDLRYFNFIWSGNEEDRH